MSRPIVIGAGLAGAATAYALARRGFRPIVIDAHTAACGASFANGGMITPSMADPWNAPGVWRDLVRWIGRADAPMLMHLGQVPRLALWGAEFLARSRQASFLDATERNIRLGLFSIDVMQEWEKDLSAEFDRSDKGTVKVYRSDVSLGQGIEKSSFAERFGVKFESLSVSKLAARHPALEPIANELAGGIHYPGDISGDARAYSLALLDAAVAAGASLRLSQNVTNISTGRRGRWKVATCDGARTETGNLVLAAGAWSARIARMVGLRLQVAPVKGYSITYTSVVTPAAERLDIPVVDDALHAAVTPLGDRLRVAGTAEFCGFDTRLSEGRLHNLRGLLARILPRQADTLFEQGGQAWAGLRPMSARGWPFIGPSTLRGLYFNCGHGALGWTQAAGSGEALAAHIAGEPGRFPLDGFAPAII